MSSKSLPKGTQISIVCHKLGLEVVGMKEYEILYDTGEARNLVVQINRMAKEGWQAKSIGALGAPTGIRAVYVLMEREIGAKP